MKAIRCKLGLWCVDRVGRTSLPAKMRAPLLEFLVVVISLVILLAVLCPAKYEHATNSRPRKHSNVSKDYPLLRSNLTHLKQAIKSIRQQKRHIVLSHLQTVNSIEPLRLNITKWQGFPDSPDESKQLNSKSYMAKYVRDGIFWSSQIESRSPEGFTAQDDTDWLNLLRKQSVVHVESGCGRMQNRLLTLANGDKACARYRKNNDQIQGEFVSFVLSRMLLISNVPPSALAHFGAEAGLQFGSAKVKAKLKQQARWQSKAIVLTSFVDHLTVAYIPHALRTSGRRLYPVWEELGHLADDEIIELVQWSDLIVLDYLTANLDRMLNNMINERWNPQMMDSPAHNLLRQEQSNLLLFLDNESGLFHGYRLLKKYEPIHRSLLDSVCIFRQSTVAQLEKLHQMDETQFVAILCAHYRNYVLDGGSSCLTSAILPRTNLHTLRRRIAQVLQQVDHCRAKFSSPQVETP